jgi:tRNA(Ile)-lysidine synthase TilS/MesJ
MGEAFGHSKAGRCEMEICKKCVLNESFPGIRFDGNGVCNFCRSSEDGKKLESVKEDYSQRFAALVTELKGKNCYDGLLAYSGGKDSTYTLYLMKEKYGLKLLAFSFNNWFQSERASKNIQNVLMHMGIDHLVLSPSFEVLREILRVSVQQELYPIKALGRATSICTTCLSLVRFASLKVAIEKEIPLVIFAMSPGQAPVATSIFKTNPAMLRKMQSAIYQPLHRYLGDAIRPYFLEERHFAKGDSFPYSVNPLAFLGYEEREIYRSIQPIGWLPPEDTDANSTNCLLNAFANQVHQEKYGFHPYAFEMAGLVRMGILSREEGLHRLAQPGDPGLIGKVKEKLNI